MNRRGFIGSILALSCAPAIVRADSPMRVVPHSFGGITQWIAGDDLTVAQIMDSMRSAWDDASVSLGDVIYEISPEPTPFIAGRKVQGIDALIARPDPPPIFWERRTIIHKGPLIEKAAYRWDQEPLTTLDDLRPMELRYKGSVVVLS